MYLHKGKSVFLIFMFFYCVFIGCNISGQNPVNNSEEDVILEETVLAYIRYYGKEAITFGDLRKEINIYKHQSDHPLTIKEKRKILDSLIENKLLLQAAKKEGVNVSEEYIQSLFEKYLSESIGYSMSEKELNELIQREQGVSLDDYLIRDLGMNVSEYKEFLRNKLIIQQLIVKCNYDELKKQIPEYSEIKEYFDNNRSNFYWNDMIEVLLVVANKADNFYTEDRLVKIEDLRNSYINKEIELDEILSESFLNNNVFQAGLILVPINENSANAIGLTINELKSLFEQDVGFTSNVIEKERDYRFFVVYEKYQSKMLDLYDLYQPASDTTVYDYIKSLLTQQKQQLFIQNATKQMADDLNNSNYVWMEKTESEILNILQNEL